jgi:predicted porin
LENFEMKKTLVAVAALVATGAFAQVSITGVVESTYNLSGANKGMTTGMNGGSEFRIGGSEDLGNGLKADFSWAFVNNHNSGGAPGVTATTAARNATGGNADTNLNAVTSYQSHVGLSGDFGSIKLGQQWAPLTLVGFTHDAMGGAATSGNLTNSVNNVPNTITYSSPTIAGVTLSAQTDSVAAKQTNGYSLTYGVGAFSAGYGYSMTEGSESLNGVGASYDFGMAKVFVSSLTQKKESDATGFGISVPVGAATLIASASSQGAADNYTLVAKYNLSKRTMAYVQNANNKAADGTKTNVNSVGISHAF